MVALQGLHSVKKPKSKFKKSEIPPSLVYETLNGKKIYYRNYEAVMNGEKNLEDIMAISALQMLIIQLIQKYFIKNFDEQYECFTGEIGLHISKNTNLSCDILIFDQHKVESIGISANYLTIPPKIVIEVDTQGDFSNASFLNYVLEKTRTLINFGTEKVVWILTEQKIAFVATPNENWQIVEWNKSFELIEGHSINLAELFKTYNIQ
jgi:Uma2 family endonuclease